MATLVRLHWPSDLSSGLSRRDRQGCDYQAYEPDRLAARDFVLSGPTAADVSDAEQAIVRLNREVTALAQKLNVQHATLLDGGRALQYSLRLHGAARHFTAFNTLFDFGSEMLELQRSPVFIIARPAAPADVPVPSP